LERGRPLRAQTGRRGIQPTTCRRMGRERGPVFLVRGGAQGEVPPPHRISRLYLQWWRTGYSCRHGYAPHASSTCVTRKTPTSHHVVPPTLLSSSSFVGPGAV
jgi:hypothetical protein